MFIYFYCSNDRTKTLCIKNIHDRIVCNLDWFARQMWRKILLQGQLVLYNRHKFIQVYEQSNAQVLHKYKSTASRKFFSLKRDGIEFPLPKHIFTSVRSYLKHIRYSHKRWNMSRNVLRCSRSYLIQCLDNFSNLYFCT